MEGGEKGGVIFIINREKRETTPHNFRLGGICAVPYLCLLKGGKGRGSDLLHAKGELRE